MHLKLGLASHLFKILPINILVFSKLSWRLCASYYFREVVFVCFVIWENGVWLIFLYMAIGEILGG